MFAQFNRLRLIHSMIVFSIVAVLFVTDASRLSPRRVNAAAPARFPSAPLGTTYNVSTVTELLNAVDLVNSGPGGDTIALAPGTYLLPPGSLLWIFISGDVTFQGDATSPTIIDGGGGDILRTFSASITVRNMTFQNANTAITFDSSGTFRAEGITITGSSSAFNGGDSGGSSIFTNSTIANNGAGIGVGCASLTLTNVTVSDNQIGLSFSSCGDEMRITNSLIVRNALKDCNKDNRAITPIGDASMDSDGTCVAMGFGPGMITQTVPSLVLGLLASNGGPTFTESISTPSVAINAGDNAVCPATDQRGFPRTDGSCDIGAFEAVPVLVLPLLKSQCMNDGWTSYPRFKSQGDCIQFVNTGK